MNKRKKLFLNLLLAICVTSSLFCASRTLNVKAAGTDPKKVSILPSSGSTSQGIFDRSDGLWYPGRSLSKDFYIQNDNAEAVSFSNMSFKVFELKNLETNKVFSPEDQEYKDFFKNMKLSLECDGKVVCEDSFTKVFAEGISFKDGMEVGGNSKKDFKMTLAMDPQGGNNLQSLENSFNFGITYVMDETTPMPKTGSPYDTSLLICIGGFSLGLGMLILSAKSKDEDNASSCEGGV